MKRSHYINIFKRISVFVYILLIACSCKKLIEIPGNPSNQIPEDRVFADSAGIMGAIAGIYNGFGVTSGLNFHSGAIGLITGLTGDEFQIASSYDPSYLHFYNNAIIPADFTNPALWSTAYKAIYHINVCLEYIEASEVLSSATKQQLLGEIKVVRALYYFHLVNLFGGVPLVTETDYRINKTLPRATIDDVYNLIIGDLTGALTMLKPTYPSAGRARPNVYVAQALLAKVYLYRGEWVNAEEAAGAVIESGLYSINADINTVFRSGSNEAIWQLPANGQFSQTAEASFFVPYASNIVPSYPLSEYLINAFEAGDLRKEKWIGTNTVNQNGNTVFYYYPYKYKNTYTPVGPPEDYMILRLAEMYLIKSEALANQGKLAEALEDLKFIRNFSRVGLPEYAGPIEKESILSAIMQERRTEFFSEWGHRWFDLKRTGKIDVVLDIEKSGWDSSDALFPVPLSEIQANPFLTQNPGYE